MTPLIIEAAINGGTSRTHNPHVPKTPEQVAEDAIGCIRAGASIIHSHVESLGLLGRAAADRYAEGFNAILAAIPDAILCPTATARGSLLERWEHVEHLAESGLIRMSVMDPGSINICNSGPDGLPGSFRAVYGVPFEEIEYLLELMGRHRLGPSIAVYDPSYLHATLAYYRAGRMPPGAMAKIYFAGDHNFLDFAKGGYRFFGLNPSRKGLDAYLEMLEGSDIPWSVAVPGGDVAACGLAKLAIERGGHVRVGLEDHAGDGAPPTNLQLVEQVVEIARSIGRSVADPATTAGILGLPDRTTLP